MAMYINGIGAISPQLSGDIKISTAVDHKLLAIEPQYNEWIDPKLLRRMSRIIRMGVTSAFMALKDGNVEKPDAIVTSTGFGCLEDTGTFLSKMILQNEGALNPTPFIQSTHNTIGSQVSLLLGCHGHNQTFTHQSFSVESALLDAMMLVEECPDQNILVGAVDEITDVSHQIMKRFDLFRDDVAHGEGAFYFFCSDRMNKESYTKIVNMRTIYKPDVTSISTFIGEFLEENGSSYSAIDLLLYGGTNQPWDKNTDLAVARCFDKQKIIQYKKFSGEYPTSAGFAIWLSCLIFGNSSVGELTKSVPGAINKILIYNPYLSSYHSLILLETCRVIK